MFVACVHWWLFGKFVQSLSVESTRKRVMVLACGRWWLTAVMGSLCVSLAEVRITEFVAGFLGTTLLVRILLAIRHRVKSP